MLDYTRLELGEEPRDQYSRRRMSRRGEVPTWRSRHLEEPVRVLFLCLELKRRELGEEPRDQYSRRRMSRRGEVPTWRSRHLNKSPVIAGLF